MHDRKATIRLPEPPEPQFEVCGGDGDLPPEMVRTLATLLLSLDDNAEDQETDVA